jgi:catechol 2,3-dioxygenase-like lactoylglutathione lyase family enzyme
MNKPYLHHVLVGVDDLERARQFYTGVLELQEIDRPPSPIRDSGTRSAMDDSNSTSLSVGRRRFAATKQTTPTIFILHCA